MEQMSRTGLIRTLAAFFMPHLCDALSEYPASLSYGQWMLLLLRMLERCKRMIAK